MYGCGTCGKLFPAGYEARENHCWAKRHAPPRFECDDCGEGFGNQQALDQHILAGDCSSDGESDGSSSDDDYVCLICDAEFSNEEDCEDHEVDFHFYCRDCDRDFSTWNGIQNHLDSNAHSGRTEKCPFCSYSDSNAGAIAQHLESASCPIFPDMNRDMVYYLVRASDPDNRISFNSIFGDRAGASVVRFSANETARKGKWYECYFCHDKFISLNGLNHHLNSQVHEEPLYTCPNKNCNPQFKTLVDLIQHLESEACGAMSRAKVARVLRQIVTGKGPLRF